MKINKKKILSLVFSVAILLFVIISLKFAGVKYLETRCNEVAILIKNGNMHSFVDTEDILSIISNENIKLKGELFDSLNLVSLEKSLYKHPAVKRADIYKRLSGKLCIEIEQRTPIVRIISNRDNYYIDEEGVRMPALPKYSSRVLVANGNISEKFAINKLFPFSKYIWDNEFWKSQIEQIWVDNNGDMDIITKVGNQRIIFGEPDNYKMKLRKLKAMYDQAFNNVGWDKYKTINLKFSNQVVCTKK
ncbi:cell division protein FtsQ/DivIB [Bacteroidota bacterium]